MGDPLERLWPSDAQPRNLLSLRAQCSAAELFFTLWKSPALMEKLHKSRNDMNYMETPWLDTKEALPSAQYVWEPPPATEGGPIAAGLWRKCRFESPPAPMATKNFMNEEIQHCTQVVPYQHYVVELQANTSAPYGEKFVLYFLCTISADTPTSSYLHVSFHTVWNSSMSRMMKPIVAAAMESGVRGTYKTYRQILEAAHTVEDVPEALILSLTPPDTQVLPESLATEQELRHVPLAGVPLTAEPLGGASASESFPMGPLDMFLSHLVWHEQVSVLSDVAGAGMQTAANQGLMARLMGLLMTLGLVHMAVGVLQAWQTSCHDARHIFWFLCLPVTHVLDLPHSSSEVLLSMVLVAAINQAIVFAGRASLGPARGGDGRGMASPGSSRTTAAAAPSHGSESSEPSGTASPSQTTATKTPAAAGSPAATVRKVGGGQPHKMAARHVSKAGPPRADITPPRGSNFTAAVSAGGVPVAPSAASSTVAANLKGAAAAAGISIPSTSSTTTVTSPGGGSTTTTTTTAAAPLPSPKGITKPAAPMQMEMVSQPLAGAVKGLGSLSNGSRATESGADATNPTTGLPPSATPAGNAPQANGMLPGGKAVASKVPPSGSGASAPFLSAPSSVRPSTTPAGEGVDPVANPSLLTPAASHPAAAAATTAVGGGGGGRTGEEPQPQVVVRTSTTDLAADSMAANAAEAWYKSVTQGFDTMAEGLKEAFGLRVLAEEEASQAAMHEDGSSHPGSGGASFSGGPHTQKTKAKPSANTFTHSSTSRSSAIEQNVVEDEVFENERFQPFRGWGHSWPGHFLPSDRVGHWGDASGQPGGSASMVFEQVEPPLPPGYRWSEEDWQLDMEGLEREGVDDQGWTYALDFNYLRHPPPAGSGKCTLKNFVRRRRWFRTRERTDSLAPAPRVQSMNKEDRPHAFVHAPTPGCAATQPAAGVGLAPPPAALTTTAPQAPPGGTPPPQTKDPSTQGEPKLATTVSLPAVSLAAPPLPSLSSVPISPPAAATAPLDTPALTSSPVLTPSAPQDLKRATDSTQSVFAKPALAHIKGGVSGSGADVGSAGSEGAVEGSPYHPLREVKVPGAEAGDATAAPSLTGWGSWMGGEAERLTKEAERMGQEAQRLATGTAVSSALAVPGGSSDAVAGQCSDTVAGGTGHAAVVSGPEAAMLLAAAVATRMTPVAASSPPAEGLQPAASEARVAAPAPEPETGPAPAPVPLVPVQPPPASVPVRLPRSGSEGGLVAGDPLTGVPESSHPSRPRWQPPPRAPVPAPIPKTLPTTRK